MLNIVEYRKNEFEILNENETPTILKYFVTRVWLPWVILFLGLLFAFISIFKNIFFLFFGIFLIIISILLNPIDLTKQEIFDRTRYIGFKLKFSKEKEFQRLTHYVIKDSLSGEMMEMDVNTRQAIGYRIVSSLWEYGGKLNFNDPISRRIENYNRERVMELGYQIELVYSETLPGKPIIELEDLYETCELIHVLNEIFPRKTFFPPMEKFQRKIGDPRYEPMNIDMVEQINLILRESDFPNPFDSYFKKFVYMD